MLPFTRFSPGRLIMFCLFGIALFLPFHGQSQKISISEELLLKNDYAYTILGWVEKDLLLFRDKGHSFFVQAFDEELHLKWEREVWLSDTRADIIGIVAHNDRFHVLYGTREKGDYYVRHKAFSHDVTLTDTATIAVYNNIFIVPRFLMEESEDKSKAVLVKEENDGVLLYSYDFRSRSKLWVKSISFDGRKLLQDFRALVVTNDGEFYLPMKSQNLQQRIQYLHIFSSASAANNVAYDTVRLGDLQAFDIYAVYDHIQQCLVVTGMVGERNTTRAKGFYFLRYRKGIIQQLNLLAFDENLLSEVSGREVSVSRGLSDFMVQEVALRQDGGVVIIAELIKEFSRRSSLPMARDNGAYARDGWVDYYFEDMILFAVHPDGTPHWKEVLRKRQYSQDDGAMYSSFLMVKTPERLRFLFNDEIKQENTVGGYEVTGTGYIERKTVFNTDYQKLKLRFKDGVQVSNEECIIPSERSNRLNLVRIVFDES
jgi:hypothetical protein